MSYKDYISTQTISTDIHISPKDIHSSINEAIYSILVSRVEGLCNQEGYILKDSVKIIQRNMGKIMNINNTSQIIYRIVYQADVISPQKDSNFECYIESITKMRAKVLKYLEERGRQVGADGHGPSRTRWSCYRVGTKQKPRP